MLINAELLLQYQRCKRRTYLDTYGDSSQKDDVNELLLKLQDDKFAHQQSVLAEFEYHQPQYLRQDWQTAQDQTLELMYQGVECIYQGVLLSHHSSRYSLLSRPNLLLKQPGNSCFGDWMYVPVNIELGKRPKQEYQVVAAFHSQVLARVQQVVPEAAGLILHSKQTIYSVDLLKWIPQMDRILEELIQSLEQQEAPEVFIARQRCNLCPWYSQCYALAQDQKHLSLLPGVTPVRYTHLQALNITTAESLAKVNPAALENLPSFDSQVAYKIVTQAQSVLENRPFLLPYLTKNESPNGNTLLYLQRAVSIELFNDVTYTAPIEIYFDIEAQPELHLNYLLGVLVVDREANTENFYPLLAEKPEDQELIWQQFLDLLLQYPDAPVYHFCVYEFDTVTRLAKLYHTPREVVQQIQDRFVDVYEVLIQTVTLPVESYALKAIARWLGFQWRDKEASGVKCIYWYDEWLKTGDRSFLEIIQRYNEDDCRATRSVKNWLVDFLLVNIQELIVNSQESKV